MTLGMQSGHVVGLARARFLAVLALLLASTASSVVSFRGTNVGGLAGYPWATLPVATEHRYRIDAKVRLLLLFWIGRESVGGARIIWRRGEGGERGYELLIGSDPRRAPRQINKWGYVSEEFRGSDGLTVGVMKESSEQTIDEAQSRLESERRTGYPFKMIRERITATDSVSQVYTAHGPRDYSYRDLDPLLAVFEKEPRPPAVGRVRLEPGVRYGMLATLSDLIHEDVLSRRRASGSKGIAAREVRFVYNAKIYSLAITRSDFIGRAEFGGRYYDRLVQSDFEVTLRGQTWKEQFTVAYSLDGPMAELPVFVSYQPRWWFKAELVLDDREVF
jgi:hypothetical protein